MKKVYRFTAMFIGMFMCLYFGAFIIETGADIPEFYRAAPVTIFGVIVIAYGVVHFFFTLIKEAEEE